MVAEEVPGSRVTFAPDASSDKRDYRVGFDRISSMLPEFHPQWTVRDGVRELRDAYARYGLTLDDLIGPRFTRLARIRQLIDDDRLDGTTLTSPLLPREGTEGRA